MIQLGQSALPVQQVDSADVVFRKVGTNQTVSEKFVKKTAGLAASLEALTPGTWTADVEVYTLGVNGHSLQYKAIQPVQITGEKKEVNLPGPGTAPGISWLKRNVRTSANNEVVVIVPDEVYDSYFEFRARTDRKYVFGIQREAINVNYLVAQESWVCKETCLDTRRQIVDINHFMPFTQTILSSPWTRNEISIAVLNESGEALLEYDRTWTP